MLFYLYIYKLINRKVYTMSVARIINRELDKHKKMIINSFTSRGAYSKETGIPIGNIYGSSNQHLVGFIHQMIRKGHIKTSGDIYWLDNDAYQKEQSRNKKAYAILIGFSIFAIILFFILMNL